MSRAGARRPPPVPRSDWAYFFDIDGTLLDIADSPGGVRLDHDLGARIEALYRFSGGAVALISGRSIRDVDALFHAVHLPAAGQHGTERRNARGHVTRHATPVTLDGAHDRLRVAVAGRAGLLLEYKGLSLALHYRRAPSLGGYAHRLVRSVLPELGGVFSIQSGKRVVELKPAGKDKGGAVREFMEETPFRGRVPVFVGDDRTDEYGFAMVNRLRGHSIKVGPGPSVARWRLRDVAAVRAWLEGAGAVSA
ncbi:MAG TPA: trehalose-phosphatase [Gemmatimonadales bacterium]|nr:trehalose-phosphatase [Gemmatimonadales bacterium]